MEGLLIRIRFGERLDEVPQGEIGEGERRNQEERHGVGMMRAGVDEMDAESGVVEARKGDGGTELRQRAVECAFCFAPGISFKPIQEKRVSLLTRAIIFGLFMPSDGLFIPEIDERFDDRLGLPPVRRLVARTRTFMRKTGKLQLLFGEVEMLGRDLITSY